MSSFALQTLKTGWDFSGGGVGGVGVGLVRSESEIFSPSFIHHGQKITIISLSPARLGISKAFQFSVEFIRGPQTKDACDWTFPFNRIGTNPTVRH